MSGSGEALFRFRGLMLEKFVARAARDGVFIRRVERRGAKEALLLVDEAGAAALTALAVRYGIDLKLIRARGPRALLRRAKRRISLPLSALIAFCLLFLALGRLWIVDLRLLNGEGSADAIRGALSEAGVGFMTPLSAIDTGKLAEDLHAALPGYSYISVRLRGATLRVEAARERPAPALYDYAAERDLIARCDAVLLRIDALSGEPAAKAGDAVRRGQLLIRGAEQESDTAERGVSALGSALGRVWYEGRARESLRRAVYRETGAKREGAALVCPFFSLTLLPARPFGRERVERRFQPLGGLFFPLRLERTLRAELKEEWSLTEREDAGRKAGARALSRALDAVDADAICVDKWIDLCMIDENTIEARAVVEATRELAVTREALMKELGEYGNFGND